MKTLMKRAYVLIKSERVVTSPIKLTYELAHILFTLREGSVSFSLPHTHIYHVRL